MPTERTYEPRGRLLPATREPLALEGIEIRLVRLPLVEPFETSNERLESRLVVLVAMRADGLVGWGEIVAGEAPAYSYETVETARHVIRDFLAPAALAKPVTGLQDLAGRFAHVAGHNMAKAGLELAYTHLAAQRERVSLAVALAGERNRVPVGVSLGIQPRLPDLLDRVERHLALGYQRIKLKIKPSWDVDIVREVRRQYPDILLSVDANAAYSLADVDHLRRLDEFGLLMIEQPFERDDLVDHAALQAHLSTSICLDESVVGVRSARQALQLGACRIINIKVGRVGGYAQALAIHDLCLSRGVPVWCGGMLESGIGRAHNLALASLPGFVLPGDISASARYFARDVIVPAVEVASDGTIAVPSGVGLGFDIDVEYIARQTVTIERIDRTTR
ncbi:MAG: o-succinylbenzoate synthase [Luteitalea sp.]|nr:o-succinylbenzoate synthase [Luteitalea sp.]